MPIARNTVNPANFNPEIELPYQLRKDDFRSALQDVYDFFHDVNEHLIAKGLQRLDDMLRPAIMSGGSVRYAHVKLGNAFPRSGGKQLLQRPSGTWWFRASTQITRSKRVNKGWKSRRLEKRGGAVDTHGARNQWMCVFVYKVDTKSEPAVNRRPMTFTEVYLGEVTLGRLPKKPAGRTRGREPRRSTPMGIRKLRESWVYKA